LVGDGTLECLSIIGIGNGNGRDLDVADGSDGEKVSEPPLACSYRSMDRSGPTGRPCTEADLWNVVDGGDNGRSGMVRIDGIEDRAERLTVESRKIACRCEQPTRTGVARSSGDRTQRALPRISIGNGGDRQDTGLTTDGDDGIDTSVSHCREHEWTHDRCLVAVESAARPTAEDGADDRAQVRSAGGHDGSS
jgi:hypothetical protein